MAFMAVKEVDTGGGVQRALPHGLPTAPKRQQNTMWIILGALLVVGAAIAGVSIAGGLAARVDVLVASRDIATGELVVDNDFRSASIGIDAGIDVQVIRPEDVDQLVGRVAAGPVGEGEIVHPANFTEAVAEEDLSLLIGLELSPGEYPREGLRPGDQAVILGFDDENLDSDSLTPGRDIGHVEVVEISRPSNGTDLLVTVRASTEQAGLIGRYASEGAVRMALKELASVPDDVQPVEPVAPGEPAIDTEAIDGEDGAGADTGGDS